MASSESVLQRSDSCSPELSDEIGCGDEYGAFAACVPVSRGNCGATRQTERGRERSAEAHELKPWMEADLRSTELAREVESQLKIRCPLRGRAGSSPAPGTGKGQLRRPLFSAGKVLKPQTWARAVRPSITHEEGNRWGPREGAWPGWAYGLDRCCWLRPL
jgi:hypothetical protein